MREYDWTLGEPVPEYDPLSCDCCQGFLGEIIQWNGIRNNELPLLDPHAPLGTHLHFHRESGMSFDFYMVQNSSGGPLFGKRLVQFADPYSDCKVAGYLTTSILGPGIAMIPPYTQPIPDGANFWVAIRGSMPIEVVA